MQKSIQAEFHINGFWYYLTSIHGNVYKDQHGTIWIRKNNRYVTECGCFQSEPIMEVKKGWISADDMFLEMREEWYYHRA